MTKTSKSTEDSVAKLVPLTPMRHLLCKFELIRPVLALGKRHRDHPDPTGLTASLNLSTTSLSLNGIAESSSEESMSGGNLGIVALGSPVKPIQRPRVALQQADSPFDAVVITTLPCYPFCCHEDLIMMTRPQLVEVANLFNSHLPRVMQIEVSDSVSDAHIRHCIETLVGIIPSTPAAPKAVRSRPNARRDQKMLDLLDDPYCDTLPSPPTSPLAMRVSRRRGLGNIASTSCLLVCLEEEDELDFFADQRPLKRRKVSDVLATPTLFREREHMDMPGGTLVFSTSVDMLSPPGSTTGLSPDLGMVVVSY